MTNKKNVWPEIEVKLREVFPGDGWTQNHPEDWLHECEEARDFISGAGCDDWEKYEELTGIEIVEAANSFYENFDYDSYPQGHEDPCFSIIKMNGEFIKVFLTYRSSGGYHLEEMAHIVQPTTMEVVVYE